MTWKQPFTPAEIKYIELHRDEWPSVLAYRVSVLFGTPRTERGIRNAIKKLESTP